MEPFEDEIQTQGYQIIAGIDEAGRGPLAGPVVAAAVVLPRGKKIKGLNDSKKLSPAQREKFFHLIFEHAQGIGVGIVEAPEIDRSNIWRATQKAMVEAIKNLPACPDFLLIDGKFPLAVSIAQKVIIKGDQRCQSIAAASIIAKVTRDRIMVNYHETYPQYNFARHKGYATKEHLAAIRRYGCCPIHRHSFKPIYQNSLL